MSRMDAPPAAALARLVDDVPPEVFDGGFRTACARLDTYVEALACELAASLGLADGRLRNVDVIIGERGWSECARWPLAWLFDTLELFGRATREGDRFAVPPATGVRPTGELREEAERLVPSAAPAYDVLELSAQALPAVLRGEARGEDVLFSPATLSLWFDYFSNANPLYAPNNRLTAIAVARAAPAGARLLELGGGGGSAAQAVLGELVAAGKPPARYVFTELHPAFLRRGTRTAQAAAPAGCELTGMRLDIDQDFAAAGLAAGSFDAVLAVNTLHLAHDPVTTLRRLRELLAPGGAVVLGELVRPRGTGGVHLELPFTLLEAYRNAPLVEGIRSRPGFMTGAGWKHAFESAGFATTTVLPAALERCTDLYAGFYCAALTARG